MISLNTKFKSETFAVIYLILSALALLFTLVSGLVIIVFGIRSGVNIILLIPVTLYLITFFALSFGGIYIGLRYKRRFPFKSNSNLGTVLIIIGIFIFVSSLFSVGLSNLLDNSGGWLRPVFSLYVMLLTSTLGLVIRNGVK